MTQILGTATFSTTSGTNNISIGFQATWMHVTVAAKSGGDSYNHLSEGSVVGTTQKVITTTGSSTSEPTTGKTISVRDNTGTVVYEASWTAFNATTISFNVTTASTDLYQALIWAGN